MSAGQGSDPIEEPRQGPSEALGLEAPAAVWAALEAALNRYLDLDPEGALGLAPLYGRIIGIEVLGLGIRLTLVPGPDRLQVFGPYDAEPDCLIRGAPLALLRLLGAERKDSEIGTGAVAVEGDSTIAHELAKALAGLQVDWEELLARVLGDPIAHPLAEGVRGLSRWGRRTADTLTGDIKEYLEEEARLLPTPYELAAFLSEVDRLRDDLERLEARVERVSQGAVSKPPETAKREPRSKGKRAKGPAP